MGTLVRTTFLKLVSPAQSGKVAGCVVIQHRKINGSVLRASLPPTPPKPAPFDYVNKDYKWIHSLFDRTTHRFDANSKVIVVEGPVASCKTAFASALACDLGMKHFPEADMNYHYIRPNGCDMRMFDASLPDSTRTYDHTNFNCNPTHPSAGAYQIMMYEARYAQYIDALAHLFNTGQGVVLERSPFSDFVFLEAMYSQHYISKGVKSVYYEVRSNTIDELLRPHLIVYLDIPATRVKELIQSRAYPYEVTGSALSLEYLQNMEHQYKERYLRDASTHAELLVYDWSGGGDVDVVIEDIERINFDKYTEREDPKLRDWRLPREVDYADKRMLYTNSKAYLLNLFNVARADVPELLISAEDGFKFDQVVHDHPQFRYLAGYNDGGTVFKNSLPKYTEHL